MPVPEGYSALAKIGFMDRGSYAAATTYNKCDVVYYNGSTWVALKDNLRGVAPVPSANWKYMAKGFASEVLSAITAKDTSAVLGTAGANVSSQALIDAVANRVMTKLIEKNKIVNNLLATDTTTVLSGPMGKLLKEQIDHTNSDLGKIVGDASLFYNLKWIPPKYIDNPNTYLKLIGWSVCAYVSVTNLTASSLWSVVIGIYDNNNDIPLGRQFAVGTLKCMERRYLNGVWENWIAK